MIQLQPDIIAAKVLSHISESLETRQNINDTKILVNKNSDSLQPEEAMKGIISRQYDSWTTCSPWLQYLFGRLHYRDTSNTLCIKRGTTAFAQYKFPTWLTSIAFDLRSYQAKTGWQFTFQSYRVLPVHAPFCKSVFTSDLASVRKMLEDKQACATDRIELEGDSVLHVSKAYETCRMRILIDMGRLLLVKQIWKCVGCFSLLVLTLWL